MSTLDKPAVLLVSAAWSRKVIQYFVFGQGGEWGEGEQTSCFSACFCCGFEYKPLSTVVCVCVCVCACVCVLYTRACVSVCLPIYLHVCLCLCEQCVADSFCQFLLLVCKGLAADTHEEVLPTPSA